MRRVTMWERKEKSQKGGGVGEASRCHTTTQSAPLATLRSREGPCSPYARVGILGLPLTALNGRSPRAAPPPPPSNPRTGKTERQFFVLSLGHEKWWAVMRFRCWHRTREFGTTEEKKKGSLGAPQRPEPTYFLVTTGRFFTTTQSRSTLV